MKIEVTKSQAELLTVILKLRLDETETVARFNRNLTLVLPLANELSDIENLLSQLHENKP